MTSWNAGAAQRKERTQVGAEALNILLGMEGVYMAVVAAEPHAASNKSKEEGTIQKRRRIEEFPKATPKPTLIRPWGARGFQFSLLRGQREMRDGHLLIRDSSSNLVVQ